MRARWDRLTVDDIEQIAGRRPQLIEMLQRRYDLDQAEAGDQADTFLRSLQVFSL